MTENAREKSVLVPAFIPILAGGASGVVTRFLTQPLDVIKIRFQLQVEPIAKYSLASKYTSLTQACRLIIHEEGLRAFWKGHVPAQMLSVTYGVIQFGLYDFLVQHSKLYPSIADHKVRVEFTSGFIAACTATIVSFPYDIVRTRLIVQGQQKMYSGTFQALKQILQHEGLRGWFRGLTPTLVQIGPLSGLNFSLFNYFKRTFHDNSWLGREVGGLSVSGNMLAGSFSGFLAKMFMYPMDLSRRRMQLQGFHSARVGFGKNFACNSLISCLIETIKGERALGLFKGLFPSLLKASIVNGLIFTIYETTYNFLINVHEIKN